MTKHQGKQKKLKMSFLLLILNKFHTFSGASTVNSEKVNIG